MAGRTTAAIGTRHPAPGAALPGWVAGRQLLQAAALVAAAGLAGPALAADAPAAGAGARQRPLVDNRCPPDRLTVYAGTVQHYQRGEGLTRLVIRTDWQTTETVALSHPGSADPSRWFRLDGAAFTAADWPRIERAPGQLRSGLRVAAWVCDDGRPATVDWQPPAR